MKYTLAIIAGFALTACGTEQAPEAKYTSLCLDLVDGDPEAAEEIMRDSGTPNAFCGCYGTSLAKQVDSVQETHVSVLDAIIEIRGKNGIGVEAAAEVLEEQLRSATNSHSFTESDFEGVGRFLNQTQNLLEDGGTCEGSTPS